MAKDLRQYLGSVWVTMEDLYAGQTKEVPFHGWHHVKFVAVNARRFAAELGADAVQAEIAGLVHDVNYLVANRSDAADGRVLRQRILTTVGMAEDAIAAIEDIVVAAETHSRGRDISPEAMALSDADTLFKALPITQLSSLRCICERLGCRCASWQRRSWMSKSRFVKVESISIRIPQSESTHSGPMLILACGAVFSIHWAMRP